MENNCTQEKTTYGQWQYFGTIPFETVFYGGRVFVQLQKKADALV